MQPDPLNIGATPDELASLPGLLLDLSTSLLPRRVGLTTALLAMLGANASEKVRSLRNSVTEQLVTIRFLPQGYPSVAEVFRANRELSRRIAALEDAVYALVTARAKCGTRIVPDADPTTTTLGGI